EIPAVADTAGRPRLTAPPARGLPAYRPTDRPTGRPADRPTRPRLTALPVRAGMVPARPVLEHVHEEVVRGVDLVLGSASHQVEQQAPGHGHAQPGGRGIE